MSSAVMQEVEYGELESCTQCDKCKELLNEDEWDTEMIAPARHTYYGWDEPEYSCKCPHCEADWDDHCVKGNRCTLCGSFTPDGEPRACNCEVA